MMEVFRKLEKVARPTSACSSPARPAPARSSSRARSTAARARKGPSSRQLRRDPREPHRERAVRPREGRLHRRDRERARASSRRPTGHALPRRDRRAAAQLQVKLLRALQERVVIRSATRSPRRSTSASSPRPTATSRRRSRPAVPRGSLLPPQRREPLAAAAARARRRRAHHRQGAAQKYADELGSARCGLHAAALARDPQVRWPGNIRQLENRIKKALVLCDKTLLGPEDLDSGPRRREPHHAAREGEGGLPARYVLEVLERNNGNRTQTARDLGVDPRTIFRYLEKERSPEGSRRPRLKLGARAGRRSSTTGFQNTTRARR
jgi:hypothetical protein